MPDCYLQLGLELLILTYFSCDLRVLDSLWKVFINLVSQQLINLLSTVWVKLWFASWIFTKRLDVTITYKCIWVGGYYWLYAHQSLYPRKKVIIMIVIIFIPNFRTMLNLRNTFNMTLLSTCQYYNFDLKTFYTSWSQRLSLSAI